MGALSTPGSGAGPLQAAGGSRSQDGEVQGRAPLCSELHLLRGSNFAGSEIQFNQEGGFSHQH